jgi:hypothetical protein
MTIVVGIFDNPRDLDEAIVKLADQGFEDTVFDESIVAQEVGVARLGAQHKHTLVAAFKKHLLKDYRVPDEALDSYAVAFIHEGKIVVVETDARRAPEAMEIMERGGATQMNRHD